MSITTSAYKTCKNSLFLSYPEYNKHFYSRVKSGIPHLVCKNMVSDQPTLLATHPEVLDIPTGSQMDLFKFKGKYGKKLW